MFGGINSNSFENAEDLSFNNQNQVIGLASPMGAIVVGRFDTPFKTVGKKADLFWHSQLGQNRNLTNATTWDLRADKTIAIQSPIISGFQGSLAYSSDIADTSRITNNASAISVNGFYKKNKFTFGVGFEQHDLKASNASTHAIRLSTTYKDGPLKVVGFFQQENNDFSKTSQQDANVFGLGLAYRKAKGTIKTQFYRRDEDNRKNSDLVAIGYDYKLQRKLDVYAQAAHMSNMNSLSGEDFNGMTSDSSDIHGISIGLRLKF